MRQAGEISRHTAALVEIILRERAHIGLTTPPVGIVLNVVCGIGRVPMGAVIRGVAPFLLAEIAVMFLLVFFPSLVLVPLGWLRG